MLLDLQGHSVANDEIGQVTYAWLRLSHFGVRDFIGKIGAPFVWGTYCLTEWLPRYLEEKGWWNDLTIRWSLRLHKPYEWNWLESMKRAYFERLNSGIFKDATRVGIANGWSFPTWDALGNRGKLIICPAGAAGGSTFSRGLWSAHVLRQEWHHFASVVHVKIHQVTRRVPGVEALWVDDSGRIRVDTKRLAHESMIPSDNVLPLLR